MAARIVLKVTPACDSCKQTLASPRCSCSIQVTDVLISFDAAQSFLQSFDSSPKHSLLLTAGNATIIGKRLFGTAYIRTPLVGGAARSVDDIGRLFNQSQLTTQEKSDTLAQAIVLGLQQREPETVATLVETALSASDANAVKTGFAEVRMQHITLPLS